MAIVSWKEEMRAMSNEGIPSHGFYRHLGPSKIYDEASSSKEMIGNNKD